MKLGFAVPDIGSVATPGAVVAVAQRAETATTEISEISDYWLGCCVDFGYHCIDRCTTSIPKRVCEQRLTTSPSDWSIAVVVAASDHF